MVWKSFKKKLKKNLLKTKNTKLSVGVKKLKKSTPEYKMFLKESAIKKLSGIRHGINDVTGEKIKLSYVAKELKKTLNKDNTPRRVIRSRNRRGGTNYIKLLKLKNLKDTITLKSHSADKHNLFSKKVINFKKNKFTPKTYYKPFLALYTNTLIDDNQEAYIQSKRDLRLESYIEKAAKFKKDSAGIVNKIIWFNVFDEKMLNADGDQDNVTYNIFIRYYNYKNLLFRSFWFSKLVSTLVRCGKKHRVWNYILRGFSFLKLEFGRSPVVLLFEILEMYRMPIRGLSPKSTTRKVVIRTHLIPWWKQYTQILRWVRHSLTGPVKNYTSWNTRIRTELLNLMLESSNSLVKKRIESNFQLIAFGKISIHFRWHRRYSKRAVKAIRVLDKKFFLDEPNRKKNG